MLTPLKLGSLASQFVTAGAMLKEKVLTAVSNALSSPQPIIFKMGFALLRMMPVVAL